MSDQTVDILKEAMNLEDVSSEGAMVAIIPMGREHPVGYQTLEIRNGSIDLGPFSENECTEIVATEM